MEKPKLREIAATVSLSLIAALGGCATQPPDVEQSRISYEVTSNGDGADLAPGDGVCETIDAECTLRAAIEESNATTGTQNIHFNIVGTPDYTLDGFNGYTIKPKTPLPVIRDTTTIDGYTQSGSKPNTISAPGPLNTRALVEVSGNQLTGNDYYSALKIFADNVVIKGLNINGFKDGDAIGIGGDNISVLGNLIGTDPAGKQDKGNRGGVMQAADNSTHAHIGGTDPEDRNLISGSSGPGSSPNTGSDYWEYYGNIFGLDIDQIAAIPNSKVGAPGSISLDNSNGHVVGGKAKGAPNVFAGNEGHGIAPDYSDNDYIGYNLVGVSYQGLPFGNKGEGITFGGGSTGAVVENNNISNNHVDGLGFYQGSDNATVRNNTTENNGRDGVIFSDSSRALLENHISKNNGGNGANIYNGSYSTVEGGIFSGNGLDGLGFYQGSDNATVRNNTTENNGRDGLAVQGSSQVEVQNHTSEANMDGVIVAGGSRGVTLNSVSSRANSNSGFTIFNASKTRIIGSKIEGNKGAGIHILAYGSASNGTVIQSSDITGTLPNETGQAAGILVNGNATDTFIGGTRSQDVNKFSENGFANIAIQALRADAIGANLSPKNTTVLGNDMQPPKAIGGLFGNFEQDIDNFSAVDESTPPDGIPEQYSSLGQSPDKMPTIVSANQSGTDLDVELSLKSITSDTDALYRVEFYQIDPSDQSQTYIGSRDLTSNMTTAHLELTGESLVGKQIMATATRIDGTSSTGFGDTSEFSAKQAIG